MKTQFSSISFIVLIAYFLLVPEKGIHAQILWTGGTDSVWSQFGNWSPTAPAANGSGALVFDPANLSGQQITSMQNDLSAYTATSITIDNTNQGTAYVFGGNQITLGGNFTTLGSSDTLGHVVNLDLVLNGNRTFSISDLNKVTVAGIIGQTGGNRNLIKGGTGMLRLDGANTFGGQVQINGGTLVASLLSNTGTAGSLGTGAGTSTIRIGANGIAGILRYEGGGGSTDRAVQIGAGLQSNHTGGATIQNFGTGGVTFTGPLFNAAQVDATAARNLVLGGDNLNLNEILGTVQNNNSDLGGVVNLLKSDAGSWRLSGENTFSGRVVIQAGTLEVTKLSNIGFSGSLGTGLTESTIRIGTNQTDATLLYVGSENTATDRDFLLQRNSTISNNGTGVMSFTAPVFNVAHVTAAARSLILSGTQVGANAITGVIQDNSTGTIGLAKGGTGVWNVTNLASTFSGAVQINSGTLGVSHLANVGESSSLGTGMASSVIRIGNASSAATLNYLGAGSTTDRQIQIGNGATQGGGTILESNGAGALVFTNPVFNAITATSGSRLLTLGGSNADSNEIQGGIQNNDPGIVSLVKKDTGLWVLSGDNTFTGATVVQNGTLRVSGGTGIANQSLTIRQGTFDLRIPSQLLTAINLGTELADAESRIQLAADSVLISSGNLTHNANVAGHQSVIEGPGTVDILQIAGTRSWTIADTPGLEVDLRVTAALTASAASGTRVFNKAGSGLLELAGDNSLANITTVRVSAGGLRIAATGNLNGVASADIRQGYLELRSSGQSFTTIILGNVTGGNGNSQLILAEGVVLDLGGTISYVADDDTNNVSSIDGGTLNLTGNRTISVLDHAGILDPEMVISSFISETGGARVLTKTGSGTLRLDAQNTYTGGTSIVGGVLQLGTNQALPAVGSTNINGGASAGTLDLNGRTNTLGALAMGGTATTVAGLQHRVIDSAGGGALVLAGNVTYNAGATGFENGEALISTSLNLGEASRAFTIADSPNAAVELHVSGPINGSQGITKGGAGTLKLSGSNTFEGLVAINSGTIQVMKLADQGEVGSLGTGTLNPLIRIGNQGSGATLEYIGQGDSTNRAIQIGGGNAVGHSGGSTILNNGSGALTFSAPAFNTAVNTGAGTPESGRILTLGGTSGESNTIGGVIRNNSGTLNPTVSVVKQDSGRWILSGNNIYSGTTTVNGGILSIDGNQATATGDLVVNAGGILAGVGVVGGATFVRSGGTVTAGGVGSIGALDFSSNLTAESGSFWLVDLVADVNESSDFIRVAGALDISGASLQIVPSGSFTQGNSYVIARYTGTLTGTFDGLADGAIVGGQYAIGYGTGSNGVITLTAVPEPGVIFVLIPLALFAFRLWTSQKATAIAT